MTTFLGVTYRDGEFSIDDPVDGDFLSPADRVKNERLSLLRTICADFDDEQEERLA